MPTIDKILTAITIVVGIIVLGTIVVIVMDTVALLRNKTLRAFREGKRARRRGKNLADNPYGIGTKEGTNWVLGWVEENREKK